MDQPRCFLLEIAVELRLQIYAEVLHPPQELNLASVGESITTDMDEDEVATTCFFIRREHGEMGADSSILRTCKQIHQEAQSLLCNPSTVWLVPASGSSASTGQPFDIRKLRTIKRLKNLRITLDTDSWTKKRDKQHSEFLSRYINPAMHVGCLTIYVAWNKSRNKFTRIMDLAIYWFKAVENVDLTAFCICHWPNIMWNWRAGRDGVWKDCTARDILDDFDNVSDEERLRLVEYFEMVKKTYKAARTSHGLHANTTIDNALHESHDGGDEA